MLEKCQNCEYHGGSCVLSLVTRPFHELIQWCNKRQKQLGWTNQTLAEKSKKVPVGTINRIKAGDYMDCKYSTIQSILLALIEGDPDEFPCRSQMEKAFQQTAGLDQQTARLAAVEKENEDLKLRIEEYRELNTFLKDELKAWRALHQNERA